MASTNATNTNYLCFARGTTTNLPYIGSISYNHTSDLMAFATVGEERMRITSGGNVGIGTTDLTSVRLRVKGIDTTSSNYGIFVEDSSAITNMFVRNDGYGYLRASAWVYGSDLRIKENISNVENGIEMVLKMKPKHFDYIDGQKYNLGFIAQDIQEIIPSAVSEINEDGQLGLKTDFLIPYLVKAIQELKTEIDALKNQIK